MVSTPEMPIVEGEEVDEVDDGSLNCSISICNSLHCNVEIVDVEGGDSVEKAVFGDAVAVDDAAVEVVVLAAELAPSKLARCPLANCCSRSRIACF